MHWREGLEDVVPSRAAEWVLALDNFGADVRAS